MDIQIEHIRELVAMKVQAGMSAEDALREASEEYSIIIALNNLERRGLFGQTSTAVH